MIVGNPRMFLILHKIKGADLKLTVSNAKKGEKITLLGGAEKELNNTMMVIADDLGGML